MTRLQVPSVPAVLLPRDLTPSELDALRLDGQLAPSPFGPIPVDSVLDVVHRAESVPHLVGGRFLAEQHTAAWILGALSGEPQLHTLCLDSRDNTRAPRLEGVLVREVVIDESDWLTIGRIRCTAPLRTAVDLARQQESVDVEVLARLLALARADDRLIETELHPSRRLSHRRRALDRLTTALRLGADAGLDQLGCTR